VDVGVPLYPKDDLNIELESDELGSLHAFDFEILELSRISARASSWRTERSTTLCRVLWLK
jgi:hypothetical protein